METIVFIQQFPWIEAERDKLFPRTRWNLIEVCFSKKYHIHEALNKNDGTKVLIKFRKFTSIEEICEVCDEDISENDELVKLPKEILVHRKALKELGDGIVGLQQTIFEEKKVFML